MPDPLEVAVEAAREGGRVLMRRFGSLRPAQMRKKGKYDWVTDSDRAAEKAILRVIRRAFPAHSVMAEESAPGGGSHPWQWLVDPLDGTVNYMHRFPMFAVSVAVAQNGTLEAGVVFDTLRNELFTALRGHGARRQPGSAAGPVTVEPFP